MPIGDLLAQIEGKDGVSSPSTKRKADGEPSSREPPLRKTLRPDNLRDPSPRTAAATLQSSNKSSDCSVAPPRAPTSRPLAAAHSRLAEQPAPTIKNTRPSRPQAPIPSSRKPSSQNPLPPTRPTLSKAATAPQPAPKAPPKKGSFAALMARASKAQEMRQTGPSIQPKPGDGAPIRKELGKPESRADMARRTREEARTGKKPAARPISQAPISGYKGSAREASTGKPGPKSATKTGKAPQRPPPPPPEPEKRPKKTALATTGYTGTARPVRDVPPKNGGPRESNDGANGYGRGQGQGSGKRSTPPRQSRPGSRPNKPFGAFSARPRHDPREDEYDSDMDDFVVDDDDDDEPMEGYGRRYDYASDGSSDMEAGLDDVWVEEEESAQVARREDKNQEAILKQRALEKARKFGRG